MKENIYTKYALDLKTLKNNTTKMMPFWQKETPFPTSLKIQITGKILRTKAFKPNFPSF